METYLNDNDHLKLCTFVAVVILLYLETDQIIKTTHMVYWLCETIDASFIGDTVVTTI